MTSVCPKWASEQYKATFFQGGKHVHLSLFQISVSLFLLCLTFAFNLDLLCFPVGCTSGYVSGRQDGSRERKKQVRVLLLNFSGLITPLVPLPIPWSSFSPSAGALDFGERRVVQISPPVPILPPLPLSSILPLLLLSFLFFSPFLYWGLNPRPGPWIY